MRRRHRGTTTVEFAIVATLALIAIFGIIEMGRALFVMNALTEATRRGARMAAVCPVADPKPASVAVFDDGSSRSTVVAGLTTANVAVQYLDNAGTAIADPVGGFGSIRYVKVSIIGFTQSLLIPLLTSTFSMSGFSTTLPRESLGIPRAGAVQPC